MLFLGANESWILKRVQWSLRVHVFAASNFSTTHDNDNDDDDDHDDDAFSAAR